MTDFLDELDKAESIREARLKAAGVDVDGMNQGQFDRPMPSVQGLFDLGLKVFNDYESAQHERTSLWTPASIGYCLKRQYLEAKQAERYQQFDSRTLRIFKTGRVFEDTFKDVFREMGILLDEEVSLRSPGLRFGGRVDLILGGEVPDPSNASSEAQKALLEALRGTYGASLPVLGVEVKSTHSNSWMWARRQNRPVAGEHQRLQAASYPFLMSQVDFTATKRHELGSYEVKLPAIDRWLVASVSKDDMLIDECGITGADKTEVNLRLQKLNNAWDLDLMPDCTCASESGLFGGREWKYCPYYPYELPSGKSKAELKGECCVYNG